MSFLKRLIHQNSGGSRYEKGRKITLNLRLQKLRFGIIQNVRFLWSRIWYFWVALGATRNLPEFTTPNVSKNTRIGLKKVGIMYVCGPPLWCFHLSNPSLFWQNTNKPCSKAEPTRFLEPTFGAPKMPLFEAPLEAALKLWNWGSTGEGKWQLLKRSNGRFCDDRGASNR